MVSKEGFYVARLPSEGRLVVRAFTEGMTAQSKARSPPPSQASQATTELLAAFGEGIYAF